ncbi:MAG: hypothetical protein NTV80_06975, partial [Verrucomicrobia bacterium]|nr:hypothetical protein [Verrucomicrobiota bacterium]
MKTKHTHAGTPNERLPNGLDFATVAGREMAWLEQCIEIRLPARCVPRMILKFAEYESDKIVTVPLSLACEEIAYGGSDEAQQRNNSR